MLYDPKWEPKTDTYIMPTLIAWLEKQPAYKTYTYSCPQTCLAAQYFQEMGVEYPVPILRGKPSANDSFGYKLEWLAHEKPRTFGAALERAKALQC